MCNGKFYVIINADDLGKNHQVNTAIDNALNNGCITSSTIMANSSTLDEVKKIVAKYPKASFGVHLNLTEGKSITNHKFLNNFNLIDENGCFKESNREMFAGVLCDELEYVIEEEWSAQVELLLNKGFQISHLDGHHHCNSWLGLENVLKRVALKYNIMRVRSDFCRPIEINYKYKILSYIAKALPIIKHEKQSNLFIKKIYKYQNLPNLENRFYKILNPLNIRTTDAFMSYSSFYDFMNGNKKKFKECIIELMCHPGHPDYRSETNMVMNDSLCVKNNSCFHLISYKDI